MRVLVNISKSEQPYQGQFLSIFAQHGYRGKATYCTYELGDLIALAKKLKMDAIYVTNTLTLRNIVNDPKPNLTVWRGSVMQTSIPIVIGDKLSAIARTATGDLFLNIDLAKLKTAVYGELFKYSYEICSNAIDLTQATEYLMEAACIVADIETTFRNQISSISFTEITEQKKVGKTFVYSLLPSHYRSSSECVLAWECVKSILGNPVPVVFHNGCFDCFHLLRYRIEVRNYIYDTEYMWRAWYAELDKALAKICSYILPDFYQWKHESAISPLEYNAKDTINTARIFLKMLDHMPDWAWVNYRQLYPNIGPVLYTSFEGILIDEERRQEAKKLAQVEVDQIQEELETIIGIEGFNPGSPKQVHILLYKILEAKIPPRAKSKSATGEIELQKVSRQHPILAMICSRVIKLRELKKAISTYYNARLIDNRLLYALSLDGTETARMACNASSLYAPPPNGISWAKSNMKNYGTQLQNIPPYLKKACKADSGFLLGNIDKSQSEARCTAYLSGCTALIEALENPPTNSLGVADFYCYTGFKFFGIEFDKADILRQAVKKIIHGTNYVMGANTFIDSAGYEKLQGYKQLVGYRGTLKNFASHLLSLYFKHYPEVEDGWKATEKEVALTSKLVTPDGWTRKVFGNIKRSHAVKRALIAHKSQHFSVVGINEALWRIFYEIQVPSNGEYRLKGQIHDSIFYQALENNFDYYERETLRVMDIPQPTPNGILRIPLDTEKGEYWK